MNTPANNRSIKGALMVPCVIALVSCVEPIDFRPASDVISNLTVSGKLVVNHPSIVTVSAGRVLDYNPTPTDGLDLKSVFLFDEDGNEVQIPATGIGKYALTIPDGFPGIRIENGKSYGIRLETHQGKQYVSSLEQVMTVPAPILLTYEPSIRRVLDPSGYYFSVPYINFYLTTNIVDQTSGTPAFLHWQIEQTSRFNDAHLHTCYRTQSINDDRIRILNGYEYTSDQARIPIHESSLNSSYAHGSYLHVIQESISAHAYEYWKSVQTVISRTGSMFEVPAGKVRSNIRNIDDPQEDVFGFFYVTGADTIRVYVDPAQFDPLPPYCASSGQGGTCISYCCDCSNDPASTTVKPYYWNQ